MEVSLTQICTCVEHDDDHMIRTHVVRSLCKSNRYNIARMTTNAYNAQIRARNCMLEGFEKEFRFSLCNERFAICRQNIGWLDIGAVEKASEKAAINMPEKGSTWEGPFCFIQAADTQFGMIESYLEKKKNPGWEKEIILTKKAIAAANRLTPKPKFFIVCGDLVDAFPGTSLREPQEKAFKEVFADLKSDIPLICVCGNHDIGNTPTNSSIENFRKTFGDDYFVFWCGGVMCIVLNSQYYEDPSQVQQLAAEQERWLEQQLLEAESGKYKHVVIFQHIPWFLEHPEEAKEYFNIANDLRMKMLEKFYSSGVKYIFCGHYHRNAGGWYKDMELVVTSAVGAQLGKDVAGMRVVQVFDSSIKHKYYALDDVPVEIQLK